MGQVKAPAGMDGQSFLPMARGAQQTIHDALLTTGGSMAPGYVRSWPFVLILTSTCAGGAAIHHEGQTMLDTLTLCAPQQPGIAGDLRQRLAEFVARIPTRLIAE